MRLSLPFALTPPPSKQTPPSSESQKTQQPDNTIHGSIMKHVEAEAGAEKPRRAEGFEHMALPHPHFGYSTDERPGRIRPGSEEARPRMAQIPDTRR